jgi:hypothetical protein
MEDGLDTPAVLVAAEILLHVLIAAVVPWTRRAVLVWSVSLPLLTWLLVQPWPARLFAVLGGAGWLAVILLPDWSPIGPLSSAQRRSHSVVKRASVAAREADLAMGGKRVLAGLVAELRALDPPDHLWRVAVAAQILDLGADPPQTGIRRGKDRLVSWPWRVALDQRIVPFRLRLDDAVRARRARRALQPGFEDLPASLRYDLFFLHPVVTRFAGLHRNPGGLAGSLATATAFLDLARAVPAPDGAWSGVRDSVLDALSLELRGGDDLLGQTRRLAEDRWHDLEAAATAGWTSKVRSARL